MGLLPMPAEFIRLATAFFLWSACSLVPFPLRAQNLRIGEPAPNFSLARADGSGDVRLSQFRGRRVVIFSWAAW
jgi:hypothetical protein